MKIKVLIFLNSEVEIIYNGIQLMSDSFVERRLDRK